MDDSELQRRFEGLTLPFEQWTHRLHVRLAFCYLRQLGYEGALARMREGIKAYNAHNRVPESPTSGFNETTTVAFVRLIAATMHAYGPSMPAEESEAFCNLHPHLLHRELLRLFYSPAQRMHPDAKTTFVRPDLTDLPTLPPQTTAT